MAAASWQRHLSSSPLRPPSARSPPSLFPCSQMKSSSKEVQQHAVSIPSAVLSGERRTRTLAICRRRALVAPMRGLGRGQKPTDVGDSTYNTPGAVKTLGSGHQALATERRPTKSGQYSSFTELVAFLSGDHGG